MSQDLTPDAITPIWKQDLYKLQLSAPQPIPIKCEKVIEDAPEFYGLEYHGVMGHRAASILLDNQPDGAFLVRKSPNRNGRNSNEGTLESKETTSKDTDFYTLSFKFDEKVHHFKLYYNPFLGHYVLENSKAFENVTELVADGLLNFYVHKHGKTSIDLIEKQKPEEAYDLSPYMTLNGRKLKSMSLCKQENKNKDDETLKRITVNVIQHEKLKESQIKAEEPVPLEYKKEHNFKITNFKGLNWCDLCANFLWGFSNQGVKCSDCGFISHQKCSLKLPPKCMPDLKRGVFGIDLTTLVIARQQEIPFVIEKCVKEIEKRGLKQEGIYRVSGFSDEIDQVKDTLDKEGSDADLSEKNVSNINVIASILKLYLRLLPIPLITFQAYPGLISSSNKATPAEQIESTKKALKELPPSHFKCLKYIVEHLNKISQFQEINKMSEHNLATVFAPTLIAFPGGMTDLSQEIFLLSFLIKNFNEVFSETKNDLE